MMQELRLSAHRLLKSPSFTALALLCIALGPAHSQLGCPGGPR
jgi:hypothetical protein